MHDARANQFFGMMLRQTSLLLGLAIYAQPAAADAMLDDGVRLVESIVCNPTLMDRDDPLGLYQGTNEDFKQNIKNAFVIQVSHKFGGDKNQPEKLSLLGPINGDFIFLKKTDKTYVFGSIDNAEYDMIQINLGTLVEVRLVNSTLGMIKTICFQTGKSFLDLREQ